MIDAPAFFESKKVHKYAVCCIKKCDSDATGETTIQCKEGVLYLPYCKKHKKDFQDINESNVDLNQYEQDSLFIQPSNFPPIKCDYVSWFQFLTKLEQDAKGIRTDAPKSKPVVRKTIKTPTSEEQEEQPESHNPLIASKDWTWILNPNQWMSIDGVSVRFTNLSDVELIGAALAIQQANFQRISKRISWIKTLLIRGIPPIKYPKKEIEVGIKYAAEKLEEMYGELLERGLLT